MITVINARGKATVDGSVPLQAMADITGVMPAEGSIYGALRLQISGTGFNTDSTTVMVSTLRPIHIEHPNTLALTRVDHCRIGFKI